MSLGWINTSVGLIVTMLAAFRITRSLVEDAFPFGVLRSRFVEWANGRWAAGRADFDQGRDVVDPGGSGLTFPHPPTAAERRQYDVYDGMAPLAYLVTCYWCTGVYVSVGCVLLASTGGWWMWAATPLAVSGVVGLLGTRT